MEINGAKMFVKALQEEGVDTLFAYPGGTAIDLFDALYDAEGIDMILPRHEQALVHAADGYARSTGRVGVCTSWYRTYQSWFKLRNEFTCNR